MSEELTKVNEAPEWDSLEEMIEYFNHGISAAMLTLTRIMWEAGKAGEKLQNDSKYGDNAIEEFSKGIHKGTSWVYECIKMYQAYTWEEITEKFLKAGIPASSIARLGSIKDEGARQYVEAKLIDGEITYEEIAKAKKEYETVVNNPAVPHEGTGGAEPTIEERNLTRDMKPDDPNSVSMAVIRKHFGDLGDMADKQMLHMEDTLVAYDRLADISDESVYELSLDRIVAAVGKLKHQRVYIDNIVETVSKAVPGAFEEE